MRISALLLAAVALVRASAGPEDAEQDSQASTVYNRIEVPPLLELTAATYEHTLRSTRLVFVKYFSPYCPHCNDFAPYFQTMYEFYYTSPLSAGTAAKAAGKTLTDCYDIKFATLDCVAFHDLCEMKEIGSYPTCILFLDGKPIEEMKGIKPLAALSDAIEHGFEIVHPGTRPKFLLLPTPGAKEFLLPSPSPTADPSQRASPGAALALATGLSSMSPELKVMSSQSAKPRNDSGSSFALGADSFQTLVTMSDKPWMVKFYAPWCHHCKAMAANWDQMAKVMRGKVNVGEVNCVLEKRVCKDAGVHGFPTIAFFKGGERVDYQGLRGLGDFVAFAENALDLSAGIKDVDAAAFKELEHKEDVIFVYFYDHATTTEDFLALERLPLSLVGHAQIVKTKDPELVDGFQISTWPRLLVSREGRPTYYTPLTPREMRDVDGIMNWMKSVWVPIVPELTAENARQIMERKIVVLGILNRENNEAFVSSKREIKRAANEWMDRQVQDFQLERQKLRDSLQMRIEEAEDRGDQRALRNAKNARISMDKSDRKEVGFAWVDGVFWQRWIRTTYGADVKDGERIVINDEDNRRYWDTTITGNYILVSRTSIMETVDTIVHKPQAIKSKLTISRLDKVFFDLRMFVYEHTYIALLCSILCALIVTHWFRGRLRRGRGGHLRLDDGMGLRKVDVFGSGSSGKVD